jgi:putative membrane protein
MRLWIAARAATLATAAALTANMASAQADEMPNRDAPFYHGHDMMWGGDQWGGFGMVLGPIFMILILVGIVVGTIYLLRLFGVAGSVGPVHVRALMLLKERYAKGEIDTPEFEERKKLLAH